MLFIGPFPLQKSGLNKFEPGSLYTPSPELRTRTVQSSGWTKPELNRTISSVLSVLVLCISLGLNFGNPT